MNSPGRWHSQGTEIVYLAESPASALLERLVHLEFDVDEVPSHYQLLAVEIPDEVAFEIIDAQSLAETWRADDSVTRSHGDRWLREGRAALLRVPSAVVPHTNNWLLNPKHPEAGKARITLVDRAPFDTRLFR